MQRTFRLLAPTNLIRLNKLVASQFQCSRREADVYIEKGWVTVSNGGTAVPSLITPGSRFDPSDITLDLSPECIRHRKTRERTILLHKPLGFVSCQPERPDQIPAIQLLTADRFHHPTSSPATTDPVGDPRRWRGKLAVAGRLDSNSTGLLVFTQSGHTASQILGNTKDAKRIEKEYLVRIGGHINLLQEDAIQVQKPLQALREGILADDNGELLQATAVEVLNKEQLRIVLSTGRKHQIRRMLRAVQWPVQAIKRVRIGKWQLGNLQPGRWRFVGKDEPLV